MVLGKLMMQCKQVYVVIQEGAPVALYEQSNVTPEELWNHYGVGSVYSLGVNTSINNEKEQSNEVCS